MGKDKICDGCGEARVIWKNHERQRFCRQCWLRTNPTKINAVSKKKKGEIASYTVLRKSFLSQSSNSYCKAAVQGCTGKDKDKLTIHHMMGRGKFTLDTTTWVTLCMNCHRWVEEHPEKAKLLGLSQKRNYKYERTGNETQPGEE